MLTAAQVRERLGISDDTLRKLIKTGQIPAIKVGTGTLGHWRITEEDLNDYIERARVKPEAVNQ